MYLIWVNHVQIVQEQELHQENPSVLGQGCENLSILADTIFYKYGKCDHQVQYETQVMQVHQWFVRKYHDVQIIYSTPCQPLDVIVAYPYILWKQDSDISSCIFLIRSNAIYKRGDLVGKPCHLCIEAFPDFQKCFGWDIECTVCHKTWIPSPHRTQMPWSNWVNEVRVDKQKHLSWQQHMI